MLANHIEQSRRTGREFQITFPWWLEELIGKNATALSKIKGGLFRRSPAVFIAHFNRNRAGSRSSDSTPNSFRSRSRSKKTENDTARCFWLGVGHSKSTCGQAGYATRLTMSLQQCRAPAMTARERSQA